MRRGLLFRFSLAFLLCSSTALVGQTFPIGAEFQVNTYTDRGQHFPAVAADPMGNFVVVWQSYGSSDTDSSRLQHPGASATTRTDLRVGGEFQVNTYTTDDQRVPSVAIDPAGDFVVVFKASARAARTAQAPASKGGATARTEWRSGASSRSTPIPPPSRPPLR